jgi:1-acyl-sn-glycerol-3-phosphate acyltransferase
MIALLVIALVASPLWWSWRRFVRACDRANRAEWGRRGLNRLDGANRIFCRRFHRQRDFGIRLPRAGGAIVVSNHVSGLDPLLLIAAARRPLRFMIAREQYARWWLKWLFDAVGCIPVERGRNPRAALTAARWALERGEVVALFPHGRIAFDGERAPLKRGVATLARATGVPVIPVRIEGVRGRGLTLPAVLLRSRVRLRRHAALQFSGEDDQPLERLARVLSGASR